MVHFVGAGSGAPDLITIRGDRLLRNADIVIYAGSLVNKELLEVCRKDCELYDSAYMTLEEVAEVYRSNRSKDIVRLHTGDPSIYGAVKEQMGILDKENIEYDCCPGVSSFCGAAAALKAEYTLPSVSQSVIITRAEGRTSVPEGQGLRDYARHDATMVIFLSASLSDKVEKELIEGGLDENTPCAVVYRATWEDEKILRGKLKDLSFMMKDINKTALIVVGKILESDYELSKLYDGSFETEYRKRK